MEGGFSPEYVESLTRQRREGFLRRLYKQKKAENEAIEGKKRTARPDGTITEIPDTDDGTP